MADKFLQTGKFGSFFPGGSDRFCTLLGRLFQILGKRSDIGK